MQYPQILYGVFIRPFFVKNEKAIDAALDAVASRLCPSEYYWLYANVYNNVSEGKIAGGMLANQVTNVLADQLKTK